MKTIIIYLSQNLKKEVSFMSRTIFVIIMLLQITSIIAKPKENAKTLQYDIVCGGSASQGYYLVTVSTFFKKSSDIEYDQLRMCAVHGVLFKGFSGSNGCTSQKPLARRASVEQEKADYFKAFFGDGKVYNTYATVIDGSIRTERIDKLYKVTATINIAKDLLYTDLTKAGIIKGLSSGF
ncbi:MAG: hypothetical protein RR280_06705 [Bacteroidaceae bacterium]